MIDATPWAKRRHRGPATVPLAITPEQRAALEATLRRATTEQRVARRAQAVLLLAEGVPAPDLARLLGVHERTVLKWKRRFAGVDPMTKLADAPRAGRPPSLFRAPIVPRSSPKPAARRPT